MANRVIMKNRKATIETVVKASNYYNSLTLLASAKYALTMASDDEKADAEKEVRKIEGSETLTASYKEALTNVLSNSFDALVLSCVGNDNKPFGLFTYIGTDGKKPKRVQEYASEQFAKHTEHNELLKQFNSLLFDLYTLNAQLVTYPMDSTDDGFIFTTDEGKKKWKGYRDKVSELLQLFTHGDGDLFYGIEMPKVKDFSREVYVKPLLSKGGDIKKVTSKSVYDNIFSALRKYIQEADMIDNSVKTTPEKAPAKRTPKKSAPEKAPEKAPEA